MIGPILCSTYLQNSQNFVSGLKGISVHNHATAFWRPNRGCQRWAALADEVNSKCQPTSIASATAGPIVCPFCPRRFVVGSISIAKCKALLLGENKGLVQTETTHPET